MNLVCVFYFQWPYKINSWKSKNLVTVLTGIAAYCNCRFETTALQVVINIWLPVFLWQYLTSWVLQIKCLGTLSKIQLLGWVWRLKTSLFYIRLLDQTGLTQWDPGHGKGINNACIKNDKFKQSCGWLYLLCY